MKRLIVAAALAAAASAFAQTPTATPAQPAAAKPAQPAVTLTVGDKAPAFTVEKWVKGDPITGFEKGKVYVVEFWATWCGPCKVSMPHLTELQKEYKDKGVTVIGTNIWEDKTYNAETLAKVEKFVKESSTMGYTVAYDGSAKAMDKAYMGAAGSNGIPTAFIVNQDGKIAYIGHPMNMDEPLKQIVAGNYDLEKAKAEYKKSKDAEKAPVAQVNPARKFQSDFVTLINNGKLDEAFKLGATALEGDLAKSPPAVYAQLLNLVAWTIVDPEKPLAKKDLDLAFKAATKAQEVSGGKSAAITDTLARVYFCKGDVAKALELEKKAVELADSEEGMGEDEKASLKADLQKAVKEYEAAKK